MRCDIGDGDGTDPTTVAAQTGELKNVVEWVKEGYHDIQRRHNGTWRFLRSKFSLTITDGTQAYAYGSATDVAAAASISRFKEWLVRERRNPPRIYLSSDGESAERWLTYIPWFSFNALYNISSNQTREGPPVHISIDPQNNLVFGPIPDDTYVVRGEYQKSMQTLDDTDDADTPEMPADYHEAIGYRAMKKYASKESAQEIMDQAIMDGRPIERALERDQLPKFRRGRSLA